jgi:endonuclease-3
MKTPERVVAVLKALSRETRRGRYRSAPVFDFIDERSPFQALVSCLVSQRARDEQTTRICKALFDVARTPGEMWSVPIAKLERLLYGGGFYRQKARTLRALAGAVLDHGIPETKEGLMKLPGIGPKCANLVLANCFGKGAIAVDTHVHRISNRLGWVRTTTPEKTEAALMKLVPPRWRGRVNVLLVAHGQLVCRPVGPRCGDCAVSKWCRRRGVEKPG